MGLVLIVDDESAIAEGLQEAISPHHVVKAYTSPFGLLEDLQRFSHEPAAIMTDYKMPGMDGLTMLEKLRVINVRCPALLLSGFVTKDVAVRAYSLGVRRIIEKPFEFNEILNVLNEVLREHSLEQQNLGAKFSDHLESLMSHFENFATKKITPAQYRELIDSPLGEPFGAKSFREVILDLQKSLKNACAKK